MKADAMSFGLQVSNFCVIQNLSQDRLVDCYFLRWTFIIAPVFRSDFVTKFDELFDLTLVYLQRA